MLALTPQMRILVAVEAVDFRKGIDSLAELCRAKLDADPFSGCLFVFRSRRATSIKVLVYDGQGFWLATKRLSKGRFRAHCCHGGLSGTPRHRRTDRFHPPVDRGSAGVEPVEAVARVVRSLAVEAGQRRVARHGVPGIAADAAPCGRDRIACGEARGAQSHRGTRTARSRAGRG